jgi:MFS family permease
MIGLVMAMPVLLLALPAGMAADRFSRKSIIMLAQVGLAASGLALAWASYHEAPLIWMYAALLGTGIFRALGWPASQAIVTGLVPAKIFTNAATWRSVNFQLAATLGPLAAGILLVGVDHTTTI